MALLAALLAAVFVYLAVGQATGNAPDLRLRRSARPASGDRQLWLIQAGSDLTPVQFWAGSAAIAAPVFAVGVAVAGVWWLALIPAIGVFILPHTVYARRRLARLDELRRAWPDALRDVLASVSAGSTLGNALVELSKTGPRPVRQVLDRLPVQIRMMGVASALELLKEEVGDATTDKVVEVLILAHTHGGNLIEVVLRDLVAELGEDLRVEDDIRTQGLEQRIESRVVAIVPWAMLTFLGFLPGPYQEFYRSRAGLVVMVIGGLWSLIGLVVIGRLARRDPEQRVLSGSTLGPAR